MPASAPELNDRAAATLAAVGGTVRQRRKGLGISAVAAAEAAGISRVTLHRIEKGESSVTIGAYMAVLSVLGLEVRVLPADAPPPAEALGRKDWIPARVRIADYPRLKELAWQIHGVDELRPREALDIYERNARHLDMDALSQQERELIEALRQAFAG